MSEYGVKRIIAQDYHRNGVGGMGAIVTVFEPIPYEDGMPEGPFLAITFPDRSDDYVVTDYDVKRYGSARAARAANALESFRTHTYAVNIKMAAEGDIEFARGNSWRAADHWGPDIAEAWRQKSLADSFWPSDPFDYESYIERNVDEAERIEAEIGVIDEAIEMLDDRIERLEKARTIWQDRREAFLATAND